MDGARRPSIDPGDDRIDAAAHHTALRLTRIGSRGIRPFPAGHPATADISVVVPVLNEALWLPRLIESLAQQTMGVREVIVVDAGSTDGTPTLAEHLGTCVFSGGGLPGPSRNAGAELAEAEWLLFLDADVSLPPRAVEQIWRGARRGDFDAASTSFVPDRGGMGVRIQHRLSSAYFRWSSTLGWPHSIGGFLFVRRTLHDRIGGFDDSVLVAEDQDYVVRLRRAGRYVFLRHPTVEIAQRRFEAEGLLRQSAKWLAIELHRICRGEIRTDRFNYFG